MREGSAFVIPNLSTIQRSSCYFVLGVNICIMRACCVRVVFRAFASRQFAPNSGPLSALFTFLLLYYFLVSERSGEKPPAERGAITLADPDLEYADACLPSLQQKRCFVLAPLDRGWRQARELHHKSRSRRTHAPSLLPSFPPSLLSSVASMLTRRHNA